MKIAIFGATGRTGRNLLEQALAGGHAVTVLVRDPLKLDVEHPKLRVLEGEVRDFGAVERTVNGADAVLSALGHRNLWPSTVISDGIRNTIMAMERSRVARIVTVAAAGILGEAGIIGRLFAIALSSSMRDHRKQLELLKKSRLDWTVVRPIFLTNGPRTGKYRVAREGVPRGGLRVSRADVAHFMLKCLKVKKYIHGSPSIAN